MTHDDFLVDDVVALVFVEREEVGEDAHYDDCGNPNEDVGGHHRWREADAVVTG